MPRSIGARSRRRVSAGEQKLTTWCMGDRRTYRLDSSEPNRVSTSATDLVDTRKVQPILLTVKIVPETPTGTPMSAVIRQAMLSDWSKSRTEITRYAAFLLPWKPRLLCFSSERNEKKRLGLSRPFRCSPDFDFPPTRPLLVVMTLLRVNLPLLPRNQQFQPVQRGQLQSRNQKRTLHWPAVPRSPLQVKNATARCKRSRGSTSKGESNSQ